MVLIYVFINGISYANDKTVRSNTVNDLKEFNNHN